MNERFLRTITPVVVNSFEMYSYLKKMLDTLIEAGFRNIIVIDQASTNERLNLYLNQASAQRIFTLIRLQKNMGPRWFFQSKIFDVMPNFFIYTDPDLIWPNGFADDLLTRFLTLSEKYKVSKIGAALTLPEDHELIDKKLLYKGQKLTIKEWESRFWIKELESNVYDAPVDTTWHLINKAYFTNNRFISGVRVAGMGYECKHLPWYLEEHNNNIELVEYVKKTKWSANL